MKNRPFERFFENEQVQSQTLGQKVDYQERNGHSLERTREIEQREMNRENQKKDTR